MNKKFLMFTTLLGLVFLSTSSYAECKDLPGLWNCFPKDDTSKVSTGDCKDMKCPNGCVEAPDGTHGFCCPEVKKTDCRRTVFADGCVKRKKIDCLPTQRCDENGVCQDQTG